MKIVVAAFYADIVGQPSRFYEFLPLIKASRFALSITNPNADYIVLTDYTTSKLFDKYKIECSEVAPEHMSLMSKIIFGQREFVKRCDADLIILPDVDCIANRDLSDSIPNNVGFATTHRGKKFDYRVNNLAYIHDRDLAYWFLDRAYDKLDTWSLEKRLWMGDQEAWQAALDPSLDVDLPYVFENLGNDVLVSRPLNREIYLYPCNTHNCFMNDAGIIKDNHRNAYMVHFKGERKQHLGLWMKDRFDHVV
jgi:hypothetical protein